MSVLVYTESEEGKFKKVAFEAVSYAKGIADSMGTSVTAIAINGGSASELANFGADKVLEVSNDGLNTFSAEGYASTIAQAAKAEGAQVVVLTSSANSRFMESEQMYGDKGEVPEGEYLIPIGVAAIKRQGNDVTIVSFGKIIKEAYKAAEELAKEGIDCEIIDLRTIRPMDHDAILTSVKKTNRLVILEESWPFGNIATEITYQVQNQAFDYLDAPIEKINTADTPTPYSPGLLAEWLPNSKDVIKAVKKVMYR